MSKSSKKNKRGARGSTEDTEVSVSKKANMAAVEVEGASEEDEEEEPSLRDIKEMLLDIQTTVSTILMENKRINKELADLKSTVKQQNEDTTKLKLALAKLSKQFDETEDELAAAKKQLSDQEEEIEELYELQDRLEQYTRKNTLEIHGIPEAAYDSTEAAVLKIAEALDVHVVPQDIEISHKLNRKGNKPIIVKFISHKIKSNLYRARAKLKDVRVSNLFHGLSYAVRAGSDRIYINENLTSYRQKIMSRANEKRRDGEVLSAWSMDGKIFVKTSPQGRPIKINELEDLEYL